MGQILPVRDIHGRYRDVKAIVELGPEWAYGCSRCRYGIVAAAELTGVMDLYLERLAQALAGEIEFCDCHAGQCQRANLLNIRQKLIEEARKDKRMLAEAARMTHPEIEWAKQRRAAVTDFVPTVHEA